MKSKNGRRVYGLFCKINAPVTRHIFLKHNKKRAKTFFDNYKDVKAKPKIRLKKFLFIISVSGSVCYYAYGVRNKHPLCLKIKNALKVEHLSSTLARVKSGSFVFFTILTLNLSIFLLWRLIRVLLQANKKRFRPLGYFMIRNFTDSSISSFFSPLGSIFSHMHVLHLLINTFVFFSFVNYFFATPQKLQVEDFWAMYLTTGLCGSLLLRGVKPALGASGAVCGLLGTIAMLRPDIKIAVIFFPFYQFTLGTAFPYIVLLETLLFLFWKNSPIGHGAHLTGLVVGYLFGLYYKNMDKQK